MTDLPNDRAELEALIEAAQAKLNAQPAEPDLSEAVERRMMQVPQIHRPHKTRRTSPDNAWPIRRADGRTPAQHRPNYERKRNG